MPGIMYTPPKSENENDIIVGDDGDVLNPDDIVEEIDLDDEGDEEQMLNEMNEMDMENYDADGDEIEDGEDMEKEGNAAPLKDDAEVVFSKHTGSVFCVSLDPSANMAVTGGEDDKAFVWKVNNGDVMFECTGHKDSVTQAAFSHDAGLVATGDMSGLLQVWSVPTQQQVWSFEVADLEWLEWHHSAPVLLAGTVDGDMWMWKVPGGETKTFQGHGRSCSIGKLMPDGKRVCAGYEDGAVKVWDLRGGSVLHSVTGRQSHQEPITCMSCHHDNALVLTGAMDVTARLLNSQTGKVLCAFDCATEVQRADQENSVEAVGFCKQQPLAATGTLAGALAIWDIPTQKMRSQLMHESGLVRLVWDGSAPLVYTCCLDGACHVWDARSGRREASWTGHTEEILDMDVSRASSVLVSACGDKTARVFSLHTPDR